MTPTLNDPVVSVVIPTFGRFETLELAIRSTLRQGPLVAEVLVVDDNRDAPSVAKVQAIIDSVADERVRHLRNSGRQGGSASRNVGIRQSKGEFVAFLDDDDYWLDGKLTAQLKLMTPGVVGVDCGYVELDGEWGLLLEVPGDGRRKTQSQMLAGYCPTSTSLVMLRRDAALAAGLFNEEIASFEDFDFWLRCAASGEFATVVEPHCVYVQHSGHRLSIALAGRLQGLDDFLIQWGGRMAGGDATAAQFRRRWRLMAFATNARRVLATDRREAVQYALSALREAPTSRQAWQACLFCAIGFRLARALSRARHARHPASSTTMQAMRRANGTIAVATR